MFTNVDSVLVFSEAVELKLRHDTYGLSKPNPDHERKIVSIGVTVLLGERVLSTCSYAWREGTALVEGPYFRDPVWLGMMARKSPGKDRGLLRIALCAAATTQEQEAFLTGLGDGATEALGLWALPDNLMGVNLGELWFPAGPDVLKVIPGDSPTLAADMEAFGDACKPFFDRILYGDPTEAAERLMASLPGFGAEVSDESVYG